MMTLLRIIIGTLALILVATIVFGEERGVSDEELFFPILNQDADPLADGGESPFLPDGTLRPEYNKPLPNAPEGQSPQMSAQEELPDYMNDMPEDTVVEDARDNSPYETPEMESSAKTLMPSAAETGTAQPVSIPVKALPRVSGGMEGLRREKTNDEAPINLMQTQRGGSIEGFAGRGTAEAEPNIEVENIAEPVSTGRAPEVSPQVVEEELSPLSKFEDKKPFVKDDIAAFGLLTIANGGFGDDLWKNTEREKVDEFLLLMEQKGLEAQGVESITLRNLLLSLMLTKAEPPAGEGQMNWLSRRVTGLQNLGMVEAAGQLIAGSGVEALGIEHFDGMPRLWVENKILHGEHDDACQYVRSHLLNTDDTFWRHALITCQAIAGDTRGLALSMDILQESDMKSHSLLFKLLKAVKDEGETPRLAPNTRFSALESALYAAYPRLLTPDVVFRLPDTILRRLMKDNSLAITYRLQAAERLVNDFGKAEDVAILSQLYDVIDFDEKLVKSAGVIEQSKSEVDGSMARALLWQAMRYTDLPSTKALILRTLWQRAESEGLTKLPGSLLPRMRGIRAESNLAWFSPYVIRATLQSGNVEEAKRWWLMLKNNKSLSRDLTLKRTNLALAFSLLDNEWNEEVLMNWWQAQAEGVGDNLSHVERVLSLLEASEFEVPPSMWKELHTLASDSFAAQGHGPGPMWLRLLGTSLEKKETGAALMLIMEPLLYAPAASISPQGIANIVTGLRFLGLENEATGLVLETLLHGA